MLQSAIASKPILTSPVCPGFRSSAGAGVAADFGRDAVAADFA